MAAPISRRRPRSSEENFSMATSKTEARPHSGRDHDERDKAGKQPRQINLGSVRLLGAEGKGIGEHAINVALFHVAMEFFRTRASRLQDDVVDRMDATFTGLRKIALNQDRAGNILV